MSLNKELASKRIELIKENAFSKEIITETIRRLLTSLEDTDVSVEGQNVSVKPTDTPMRIFMEETKGMTLETTSSGVEFAREYVEFLLTSAQERKIDASVVDDLEFILEHL